MKKLLCAVLVGLSASTAARAQENIYSSNFANSSVSVTDGQTFVPLPTTASLGPNTINTGANSNPSSMFYDANRRQVYAVATTTGVVFAIDPISLTTKSLHPKTLVGPLTPAGMSEDGRFLYAAGADTASGRFGIWRVDLDNFTDDGATFMGGFAPAASTTYVFSDTEVAGGKAYFTYTATFSSATVIVTFHVGEVDLGTGVFTNVYSTGTAAGVVPRQFTRITRSPDSSFVLVAATTGSMVNPASWQMVRVRPASPVSVADVVTVPTTGCSPSAVEDIVFTTGSTVCILAADDCSYRPRFFDLGATGTPGARVDGPTVPSGFGGEMTLDLPHNRIFFAHNGSTGFPNHMQILSPPSSSGAFLGTPVNMGGSGPIKAAVAPAPPRMQVDFVTQPAAISSAAPFQLEIQGRGFIPGSSRARVQDNGVGILTTATTTNVLNDGVILASFPALTAQNYDVSVVNNDGQLSLLNVFFQGLPANPATAPFTVPLPPLTAGYSMLSFPQYATVGDLRAGVTSQLGAYNPIQFRLFLWDETRYLELNNAQLSPSESIMGKGFFALTRLGDSLTLAAPDVNLNAGTFLQRVVALSPGWNIVSQPWLFGVNQQIALAQVQVTPNRDLTGAVVATASPLITGNVVYEPANGKYQTSVVLTAGKAYWLHNNNPGTLYLIFNRASVTKPAGPVAAPSAPSGVTPPPMPGDALSDSGGGGGGGCGLLGPELLLLALFLRGRGRRRLSA